MTSKDDHNIPAPASPEEDYSLEDILEEFGGSLERHLLRSLEPPPETLEPPRAEEAEPAAPAAQPEAPAKPPPAPPRRRAPCPSTSP